MHILIGIPTPEHVHNQFGLKNLPDILAYYGRRHPELTLSVLSRWGVRTDANRNAILEEAMRRGEVDYILWLDADMLYPVDIIEKYLAALKISKIDVLGCLYFRRGAPYDAIAFEYSGAAKAPYRPVNPALILSTKIYEIDAVGFGGMLVNMEVYKRLGERRWMSYGCNYHIPHAQDENLSHDIEFCRTVKQQGMSVKLHGGVRPAHMEVKAITIDDWRRHTYERFVFDKPPPVIDVLVPLTGRFSVEPHLELIKERAGVDCRPEAVLISDPADLVPELRKASRNIKGTLLAYLCLDPVPGENWLKHAVMTLVLEGAGLASLNDGVGNREFASSGLVDLRWLAEQRRPLFEERFHSLAGAAELSTFVKNQQRFAYAQRACVTSPYRVSGLVDPDELRTIQNDRIE